MRSPCSVPVVEGQKDYRVAGIAVECGVVRQVIGVYLSQQILKL